MSRSQRIALARAHRRRYPLFHVLLADLTELNLTSVSSITPLGAAHGCYDAMDDLDPYQDVNPSESIVFVRGNRGMPCS